VAVIDVPPVATAVTRPVDDTVAIDGSAAAQVTARSPRTSSSAS
jgi:hypothetical protein